MRSRLRPLIGVGMAIALVAGMLSITAPAGAASSGTLCSGYSDCAKSGKSNHGYLAASDNLYWRMAGGHNCTNYVAYRLVSQGAKNLRPWSGDGNAHSWGGYNKDITDRTPVAGAVAWWDSNEGGHGNSGHVAWVEKVVSSTEIIVSEDNWQGNFFWKRITKSSGGWPSGFIHFDDSRTPAVPAWSATQVNQYVFTDSTRSTSVVSSKLQPGSTAWVELRYLNTGTSTWRNVVLGTQKKQDRPSALANDWVSENRAATQKQAVVKPGQVATFGFTVRIPKSAKPGTIWSEHFAPVKNSRWMLQTDAWVSFGVSATPSLTATPRPTVSGTLREGRTLTAVAGTWAPAGTALSYQWKRDGIAIARATGRTHELVPADVGRKIAVTISGVKSGFTTSLQTSINTAVISSSHGAVLAKGHTLAKNAQLVSTNGAYRAIQRGDNLEIWDRMNNTPIWANAVAGSKNRTKLTTGGNLVTYNSGGTAVWSSRSSGSKATKLVMGNDGVLALYTAKGKRVWSSLRSGY